MVDGWAICNDFLMGYHSNILNMEIKASAISELSAMGPVYLAGLASGIWESTDQIKELSQGRKVYRPSLSLL